MEGFSHGDADYSLSLTGSPTYKTEDMLKQSCTELSSKCKIEQLSICQFPQLESTRRQQPALLPLDPTFFQPLHAGGSKWHWEQEHGISCGSQSACCYLL